MNQARYKIVRAGRKGGKTVLMVEDLTHFAVSKANRNVFYIAPTQVQARDIVWNTLRNRLAGVGKFNEQRLEVVVPTVDNGQSLIKLAGWENRENFRGKTSHKLVFDETDTMIDFFIGWQDIFRPTLLDTGGNATFIGTPKKENPNLRRLEKLAETDRSYQAFHFTSKDNPHLSLLELQAIENEYKDNQESYRQEILAEHIDDTSALFNYNALLDIFINTAEKTTPRYLTVDIADDGSDKSIFSFWNGLEEYKREEYERMNTELLVNKIREDAKDENIPYSNIAVDAIGVGAGVANNSMLNGIVGFKGSYQAIRADIDIVQLPNASTLKIKRTTDYKNLRCQCVFTLAGLVNNRKIASKVEGKLKEYLIDELSHYQDVSAGDGKRMATMSEDIKALLGRSPDNASTWIMRMYWEVMAKMRTQQPEQVSQALNEQQFQFDANFNNYKQYNSNK